MGAILSLVSSLSNPLQAHFFPASPPQLLPESYSLRISWQIGAGGHGAGGAVGPTAVGVRGGPWQDGWLGLVTFQWPDMSEQEVTTAPPGRRHSSFWSLVQVPGAGWRESDSWGQHSHAHPAVGQCPQAVLDGSAEGPGQAP